MRDELDGWALVLGASDGFGGAAAIALARAGMDIAGVHLDRKATLPNADKIRSEIEGMGRRTLFFNLNATDEKKRQQVIQELMEKKDGDHPPVKILLHSLAFGALKGFISDEPEARITQSQMEMTLDVMANSLVYWVQDLVHSGLIGRGGRVFSMTSAGSMKIWHSYGAISAAKAALESHTRQLAVELAPRGITVNALRAGVTNTASLRRIPGHEEIVEWSNRMNPSGRMTTPEDVAAVIVALCRGETDWCTGNVIGVDGGEFLV